MTSYGLNEEIGIKAKTHISVYYKLNKQVVIKHRIIKGFATEIYQSVKYGLIFQLIVKVKECVICY